MRTPAVPLTGLLALALVAAPAQAQLGLDLSDETEAPESTEEQEVPAEEAAPMGMGLDLSGDVKPSPELLPRVVFLGMDTPERAGAAQASRWLKALTRALEGTSSRAVPGATPGEARERLVEGYGAALRCAEASCLAEPAETLDADLLLTSRLALEDEGWTFRLWTYDRDRNQVEVEAVTGRSPRDSKFIRASMALLADRVKAQARPRALLRVNVNVPHAVVRLGERTLGVGSVERRVAPVESSLIVEADEYAPFARTVPLRPGETSTVEVYLESAGPPPESPSDLVAEARRERSSAPTIFSRPALYSAAVGVLAVVAGVVVGQQAKKTASRAPDANGDGIADITRKERIDAKRQVNLSTALVAGGAGVAGASAVWLVLVPARGEPARATPSVGPVGDSGASTALHLIVGGSF